MSIFRQESKGKHRAAATPQAMASHSGSAASVDMEADAGAPADEHQQLHGCAQEAADATQDFANAVGREVRRISARDLRLGA